MTTDTLSRRCKIATDCLPLAPYRTRLEALHTEMLDSINQAPAWHDAPTVPGLWLNSVNMQAERVSQRHIDVGVFDRTHSRWYGPTPREDVK